MTLEIPASDFRQLLPLPDAIAATMTGNPRSFYRWARKWGVQPFRHGLYRRKDLADGLEVEERVKVMRAAKARRTARRQPSGTVRDSACAA